MDNKKTIYSTMNWLAGVLGFILAIFAASPWISSEISKYIIVISKGQDPQPVVHFLYVSFFLSVLFCISAIIFKLLNDKNELRKKIGREPKELYFEYDNFLRSSQEMKGIVYAAETIEYRFDIIEKRIIHEISDVGDTLAEHEYIIECTKAFAHFFGVSINTDDQASPVYGFRDLDIEVSYQDRSANGKWSSQKKSHFIPTYDATRCKKILIFFEEMSLGEQRKIILKYRWRGFWKQLFDRRSTVFEWSNIERNNGGETKYFYEWRFAKSFPKVTANISDKSSLLPNRLKQTSSNGKQYVTYDFEGIIDGDSVRIEI